MAAIAALSSLGVVLLLPKETPAPPVAPATINEPVESSVASSVYLFAERLSSEQSLTLSWDWTVEDGKARATVTVTSDGEVDTDIWLILTGPIASAIKVDDWSCVHGLTTTLPGQVAPGSKDGHAPWGNNFWEAPKDQIYSIQLMNKSWTVSDDPPPYIYRRFAAACSVGNGFASDDPPTHRLYHPRLMAGLHTALTLNAEDQKWSSLGLNSLCARRSWQGSVSEQACASQADPWGASLKESLTEGTIESEQGWRDARLLGLGVLAAVAAQALFELLRESTIGATDQRLSSTHQAETPRASQSPPQASRPLVGTILLAALLAWFVERLYSRRR